MTILTQYAGVENLGREAGPGTRLTGKLTGKLGREAGPGTLTGNATHRERSPRIWEREAGNANLGTRAPGAVLRSGLIPQLSLLTVADERL